MLTKALFFKLKLTFALLLTFLAFSSTAHSSQLVEVQIGAAKDNTLYESSTGALSNGAGDHFFVGRTSQPPGTSIRRGLLHFDIASNLPTNAVVQSAELKVFMSGANLSPSNIELHRVVTDWGEGISDAPGSEGGGTSSEEFDATWIHSFFSGSLWTAAGGDFDATVSSATSVGSNGFYTFPSDPAIVADVQNWLDGVNQNFGWIMLGDETVAGNAKRFDTRENSLIANRPVLTVVYTPPPCCIGNRGDIDNDGTDSNNLDLTYLVDFIFRGGPPAVCPKEADLNVDGTPSNILDLTFLVDFIFRGGPASGPC